MSAYLCAPIEPSSPAGRLFGVTPGLVDVMTATFTAADWCQLQTEWLDHISIDVGRAVGEGLAPLGVDQDDDPIAVFCLLYLKACAAEPHRRCQAEHPEYHAGEVG